MVEMRGEYLGKLEMRMVHGPSGATLATDAPADNGGRGASFSPTDLVGVALGSCMVTTMGIVARRDGIAMEGARVRVEKHMSAEGPRRIARLPVVIAMPKGVPVEARAKLEQAARACPVSRSLHPDVAAEVVFEWAE